MTETILPGQLPLFGVDPTKAHARRTDPVTSHEAAAQLADLTARQQAVLRLLTESSIPLPDVDLVRMYQDRQREDRTLPLQGPSGIRTRRSELVIQGKVYAVDKVKLGTRRHIRWGVYPNGGSA